VKNNIKILLSLFILVFTLGCNNQPDLNQSNLTDKINGIRPGQDELNLHAFLTYAVIGGEEVTLNGEPIIVRENVNPQLNANVHSNNEVILNGEKIYVKGFVTYNDNIIIDGDDIRITPAINPKNLPQHYQVSSVNIPGIDIKDYKSIADIVYDSDKELSGNINLGSETDPVVIYVGENLYLDNITFNGYGIILVEDEVEVVSDTRTSSPHPDHSKVLIVSGGKFKLNNSSTTLHASVYAKNEININAEDAAIEGSLATLRKNTLNGNNIKLQYKPVHSALAELVFGTP
jgi:hypothetical protein